MLKKINWVLLFILLFALIIRLIGTTHAFPFIFHPDEPSVVRSALALRFDLNPKHFDWPHLYFYLNYAVYAIFIKFRAFLQIIGLQSFFQLYFPLLWRDPLVFYFISRVLSALLGAFTIIPLYLTGKRLYNTTAGLAIALVMTLIPLHVWNSHYALIDVPGAFFVAWVCYFSANIYKNKDPKYYLLDGLFVGFAASTKYHGALSALSIIFAHLLVSLESKPKSYDWRFHKSLVLAGIVSLIGFLIGTPYALFDYKTFSRTDGPVGAFWQFTNVGSVDFFSHIYQFVDTYLYQLSENTGYTFLLVLVVAFVINVYQIVKNKKIKPNEIWIYLLPAILITIYLSGFKRNNSHYYIQMFPYLAIVVGYYISEFYLRFISSSKLRTIVLVFLLFLPPLYLSLKSVYVLGRQDTRNLLFTWMLENVKSDDMLVYNSNGLNAVLEKFKDNEYTKQLGLVEDISTHGYLFLNINDKEMNEFFTNESFESKLIKRNYIQYITWFSAHNRTGDNIFIYEINP